MKNALLLHGTKANPHSNWFDWLRELLEKNDYNVWVPELPGADRPNMTRYREFIFGSKWQFDESSLIVGHSSGAVTVLSLLEALPEGTKIDTAVMVGVYRPEKEEYSSREAIDIDKVQSKAKRFVFIHSDNDHLCPLEYAQYYAEQLGGELVIVPGGQHFSDMQDQKHRKLPELVSVLGLESEKL